ncbi:MAG TPA: NAD(P)-binding domain-containing protein [Candidatus Dormibacteraeota bacterium]
MSEPWVRAFDAAQMPEAERARLAEAWRAEAGRPDRILLLTCHRAELYGLGAPPPGAMAGAEHLLRVAAGLESAVVGEDEVLHQVRGALLAAKPPRDVRLTRLFETAIAAGRRARAGRTATSAGLAERALGWLADRADLEGRSVVVAGAGRMGWALARAAGQAGGTVTIASRSRERAEAAARSIGARAADLTSAARQAPGAAAVAVALAGPWAELTEPLPPTADLSWPSAVPPRLRGQYLGVDDLFAGGAEPPPGYVHSATAIVAAKLADYRNWLEVRKSA